MACTEITSHKAKQAVTSFCNKDVGLAVICTTGDKLVHFWVTFHFSAGINNTGIEETGYSDFQQLIVLHRLYAVSSPLYLCILESLLSTNYYKYMVAVTIGGKV